MGKKIKRVFVGETVFEYMYLFGIFGSVGGFFGQHIFWLNELWYNAREQRS